MIGKSATDAPKRLRTAQAGLTFGASRAPVKPHTPSEGLTFAVTVPVSEPGEPQQSAVRAGLRLVASGGAILA